MSHSDGAEQASGEVVGLDGQRAEGVLSLPTQFRVEVDTGDADAWVRVEGELDIYTSPELSKAIEEALETKPQRVMVAMTLVSFMDSSAISVLVRSQKSAELCGSKLVVHQPARGVRRTLDLAGLSDHLLIES